MKPTPNTIQWLACILGFILLALWVADAMKYVYTGKGL